MTKSLGQIVQDAWLSSNPGYYSLSASNYLNEITVDRLQKISDDIAENFGKTEQEVFHKMLFDLPTLKPTYFLSMLYRLTIMAEGQWWRWEKHVVNHYAADLWGKVDEVCPVSEQIKTDFKKLINREPIQK